MVKPSKSADKRALLLDAAIALFAEGGFWNTSTASIARHAGVATGTLFNYFANKEALIDAVYVSIKQELFNELSFGVPDEAKPYLEHVWFKYIHWSLDNPIRHELLMQLKLSDLVSKEAKDQLSADHAAMVQKILPEVETRGLFKEADIQYIFEVIGAQMEACASYAKSQNLKDMALAKHITTGFDLLWDGLAQKH